MKATRHNGRAGKHGVYNPKHNDREFDEENSEHIDAERTKFNVYWDCYQGYSLPNAENERAKFTFTEVEKAYYVEHYSEHVDGQNERNRKARHYDRVKTIDGILTNTKTCPEETLLQLGNIDGTVSADVLAQISAEYFEEFNKRYGSHVHILDWALHLDEATPHIHERHVFDALNQYGELCPQQDKALEELGFELPKPNEKKGKYNNRKMVFDDECRKLFIGKESAEYLKDYQKQFMPEDADAGMILAFLDDFKGDRVCSKLLWKEALHRDYEPKRIELKQICDIMNNSVTDWVMSDGAMHFGDYGKQRGWVRVGSSQEIPDKADSDGFMEIPKQLELEIPFK